MVCSICLKFAPIVFHYNNCTIQTVYQDGLTEVISVFQYCTSSIQTLFAEGDRPAGNRAFQYYISSIQT